MLAATYDGDDVDSLRTSLGVAELAAYESVTSTMDVAHRLASDGAAAGTIVLADTQTAGRGRSGRRWSSAPGAGVWLTAVERPRDPAALDVLSLRVGLALAEALDPFADVAIRLKWPNDLFVEERKLAGVLVETRWRDGRAEWVAIGVGVNVVVPHDVDDAVGLRDGTPRSAVLHAIVPAVRRAAAATGALREEELAAFAARDLARGRRAAEPVAGGVEGISTDGALRIRTSDGRVEHVRHGSLRFADDARDGSAR